MKKFSLIVVLVLLVSAGAFAATPYVTVSSPTAGATVASPVTFSASAYGGGYAVTAIRIYVDSQSMYTVYNTTGLNTSLALATGSHYVVVQAWNSAGQVFNRSLSITVSSSSGSGSVSVSSPTNGSTAASPVHFVASAAAPAGRVITAMRIYVDSASAYTVNAASLNTYLGLATGGHSVVVQAWDNTGAVYKNGLSVNVGSSTSSSGSSSSYANNLTATSNWLAKYTIAPDGAILYGFSYTTNRINPYYSNLAAMGFTKDPTKYTLVQNWMKWYIAHLNWPDKWGLYGTTYDYNVSNGVESSTGDADSTDSYAATFLSLAWAYYQTGDAGAQSYVRSIKYQLDMIGGVLVQTQQSDGLTWAKPSYQIKYLMDNSEAYRGLRDLAALFQALGDGSGANYYNGIADHMLQGINGMWMPGSGAWAVYKDALARLAAPSWGTWYPDATSQMFPVLYGVVSGSDPRSQTVYSKFNGAWPGWPQLSFNSQDQFPWAMIAGAAARMGDSGRVNTYITTVHNKYVSQNFPWPWYNMEAGWFIRVNNYMMGKNPF